jgi:hypothetical protein
VTPSHIFNEAAQLRFGIKNDDPTMEKVRFKNVAQQEQKKVNVSDAALSDQTKRAAQKKN